MFLKRITFTDPETGEKVEATEKRHLVIDRQVSVPYVEKILVTTLPDGSKSFRLIYDGWCTSRSVKSVQYTQLSDVEECTVVVVKGTDSILPSSDSPEFYDALVALRQ